MGYTEIDQSYTDICVKASSQGKTVIPSNENTLQIDIDSEKDWSNWINNSRILLIYEHEDPAVIGFCGCLEVNGIVVTESSSGYPHRHITVTLKEPADIWKRIALQSILGSHITRECLDSRSHLSLGKHPIVFFEKEPEPFRGRRIILE